MKKKERELYLKLNVRMFGEFRITNEDGMLNTESIRSEMLTRLLTYMLCHRNKRLTAQELIDVLWSENESENPTGALKNLMYRLRNCLKKVWGDCEFILTGKGTYKWNPEIGLNVDTEKFEYCCKNMINAESVEEQLWMGKKAIELYQGVFLPKLSEEYWVISMSTYYHSMYLDIVKKLVRLMEKEKRYSEVEEICQKAFKTEPLDEEIHCFMLRALIANNKQKLALEHYKQTERYLYDVIGVRPSKEMQEIYEKLQQIQHDHESNIDVIQEELKEQKLPSGAFLCEYGVFRKIYILESRSGKRMGISVHLVLISLQPNFQISKEDGSYLNVIREEMEVLKTTLLNCMRSSDVICKYSVNQFLVMLPACKYEDAKMVIERLKDQFYKMEKTDKVILQYSICEIDDI